MAKRLNKKTEYNTYLAGCTYLGIEPEYAYEDLTARQFSEATEALRARVRKLRMEKVVSNTAYAVGYAQGTIERTVGEPLSHFRDRVAKMAKATGKAIPVSITFGKK